MKLVNTALIEVHLNSSTEKGSFTANSISQAISMIEGWFGLPAHKNTYLRVGIEIRTQGDVFGWLEVRDELVRHFMEVSTFHPSVELVNKGQRIELSTWA